MTIFPYHGLERLRIGYGANVAKFFAFPLLLALKFPTARGPGCNGASTCYQAARGELAAAFQKANS
jgi:hypothetical protein